MKSEFLRSLAFTVVSYLLLVVASPAVMANDFIIPPDDDLNFKAYINNSECTTKRMAKIDLLFVQEPQFSGLEQKTNAWIRSVNAYFRNSRIFMKVRKVGLVDHDFNATTMRNKLGELKNSQALRELRNRYRADFVQGITSKNGSNGAVGIGFITTSPNYAFSVVRSTAGPVTVAHELGHNLGLGHSVLQGSKGRPYAWGRGHGVRNKFGTIMSYAHLYPAPRIHQFSNPQQRCSGVPCGVDGNHSRSANSVRAINCVRFQVSRHR